VDGIFKHMKEHSGPNNEQCLRALTRFLIDFDGGAGSWLIDNSSFVGDFMVANLDLLTAQQRIKLYVCLFGFFRLHYKRVVDARLRLETDLRCQEVLAMIAKEHRELVREPYSPVTDKELLAVSENNLTNIDAALRLVGALGVWALTKEPTKVIPVLLEIVKDRRNKVREEAALLFAGTVPLNGNAISVLRIIAHDKTDPIAAVAEHIVKGSGN
jgi:hypothetical protein